MAHRIHPLQRIDAAALRRLRDLTGAGLRDCADALEAAGGDVDRAVLRLREKGIARAEKKAGRATANGVVEAYLHRTGDYPPQTGAMVELLCETDFVAKGADFRGLAREIAMQVAAAAPRWVSRDDVPGEVVERQRATYRRLAEDEGRPERVMEQIVEGQVDRFLRQRVLLDQPYVRDPKTTVGRLIADHVGRLRENIRVGRFARFAVADDAD